MITTLDLCGPQGVARPAHHSPAPAAFRPALTRIVFVRAAPFARMENACTMATGPLLAIIETPREDSHTPVLAPIGDLPDAGDRAWIEEPHAPAPPVPLPPSPRPVGVVPEPSTWALLILGFGMLGARLRRRFRSVRQVT